MRKLIFINFFVLILNSCNTKVEFKSKFGLEYYYIGGASYTGNVGKDEIHYYYIKDIDKLILDEGNINKLLQFAYCKFNSKKALKSISVTSKYFEDYYDIEAHYYEEKKIVANISFIEDEGIKRPYISIINNGIGSRNSSMQDTLLRKTDCSK